MRGAFCVVRFLTIVALFYALTPGILTILPSAASNKMTVTLVHGIIFAFALWLVKKIASRAYPKALGKK